MHPVDERERESVLRDLECDDEEVRRLAVERAPALGPEEAVPRLVECLGDSSWRVRKAAVMRLAAWPDGDVIVDALIAALADGENPGRRNAAVDALVQSGAAALPRLVAASDSADVDVRKFVVDVLAGIGDSRATPALIARLGDVDVNVCAAATDALGAIGGPEAIAVLARTATEADANSLVRFSALHALRDLEVPMTARQLGGALADPVLRPAALDLLGRIEGETEAFDVLLKALEDRARSSREAAMRSLLRALSTADDLHAEAVVAAIREVAERVPQLAVGAIERLSEADLATRMVLVQFLGLLQMPEAAVPLLLAARDEALQQVVLPALESMGEIAEIAIDEIWSDLPVASRRDACTFFARGTNQRSADRLVAALEDPDLTVRSEAARACGVRALDLALAPLVHRLVRTSDDADLDVEEESAAITEALVAIAACDTDRADRTIEHLSGALSGAPEAVRVAIACVLGSIGRREDHAIVALLLKDPCAAVRRAAVDALARLEPGAAAEPLHLAIADESAEVRIAVSGALAALDQPGALQDLCRLVEDGDVRVRAAAIRVVGLQFATAEDPDLAARAASVLDLACDDEAPVALAAIEAAREIGGGVVDRMRRLFTRPEPEVVREAVRCLGVHGSPQDLESAIPLAAHPDWSVRAEAIQVLADRGMRRSVPAILRRLDLEQDDFVRSVTLRALERLEA